MASLSDPISTTIKLILMGSSGEGKSSAIIPLAVPTIIKGWPGKKLFVLSFDGPGKFAELAKMQLDDRLARRDGLTSITAEQHATALTNIQFEDCIDPKTISRTVSGCDASILSADAWPKAKKTLEKWYPTLTKEPQESILVIDSFTFLAGAIANYTMALAGRLNKAPVWQIDYGPAQHEIEVAVQLLSMLPCSVIVTAHQSPMEVKKRDSEPTRNAKGEMVYEERIVDSIMLPSSFGQGGRMKVPATFNHLLFMATNQNGVRELNLRIGHGITPKTPFFARADKSYGIDTGLVKYFALGESTT